MNGIVSSSRKLWAFANLLPMHQIWLVRLPFHVPHNAHNIGRSAAITAVNLTLHRTINRHSTSPAFAPQMAKFTIQKPIVHPTRKLHDSLSFRES
jgi:hypothetical protein